MDAELSRTSLDAYVRLSVAMANYNHGLYLKERIASILKQLGENDEFIIIDDASTDNSVEVIRSFSDPRIRFYQNSENKGVVYTASKATKAARGEFLMQLSADDKMGPGCIETAMTAFAQNPEAQLFCADYGTFSADEAPKIYQALPSVKEVQFLSPQKTLRLFRKTTFCISGHTIIVRPSAYLRYGGLDTKLGPYCDWFLWHSIALHEPIIYAPCVLSFFRIDGQNFSKKPGIHLFHQALLLKLAEKDMRPLKKLFRQSTLLYPFVRKNFSWALKRPCLWHVFGYTILKNIIKRWQRSLKKRLILTS